MSLIQVISSTMDRHGNILCLVNSIHNVGLVDTA